jgi:hypothetical protein
MPETGVTVSVKRIVSGAYVTVVSGNTDGNGQMSCYLVPGTFYKVLLNKTGFNDGLSDWTPSDVLFTCTFKIYYTVPVTTPVYDFSESIHISGSINNATGLITVTYTDELLNTTNLQIYIYDVTLNYTLVHTNSTIGLDSVTTTHTGNNTHDYQVVYKLNHTYFEYRAGFFLITGYHRTITTMTKMNLMFAINFGYNPFGWSNVITWFIIVGCFFSVERRDSYMAMFMAGFILLFVNYYIGFNTVMSFAAGGAIPVMMIVFGILMLIRDRARFSNDM